VHARLASRYVAEGNGYKFGGNAIVEGAPLNKFPGVWACAKAAGPSHLNVCTVSSMCFVLWLPVQATYQQQMSQGLRRWLRLGERCTRARRPRPAGAALCLFLRPASVIWCLVCLCWRSHSRKRVCSSLAKNVLKGGKNVLQMHPHRLNVL